MFLWGKSGWALSGVAYSVPVAAFFLYMVAFMDTTATIPTGAMAERWKWKAFVGWGLFCGALYYPIFGGWTWGGGWLSQLGNSLETRLRLRRLRGFRRGARDGWHRRSRRCDRARRPNRQVRTRRQAAHPGSAQHPDGPAGNVHPAVRLVRVQRRVDVRGDRPPLHRGGGEHRDRGRVRCDDCDVLLHEAHGQARPRHDGQRHARRSRWRSPRRVRSCSRGPRQ